MSKPLSNVSRVVSLNGLGRNRSPGLRVLNECRDILVEGLCNWLRDVAPAVSGELFVLADSTRERLQQTRYLDLRADIEKDWQHFVGTFRRNLSAEAEQRQDEILGGGEKDSPALEIPDFEGLQLIDDNDLSQHIVIREFSAQLEETCDEELYTLNRRVAALLGQEDKADASGNPLAPAAICHALSDSCTSIGSDPESRLILLRRIERHLHVSLPGIYKRINDYLVERGILPDLKRTFRRPSGANREASVTDKVTSAATPHAAESSVPPVTESSILDALQRLALARSAHNPGGLSGQIHAQAGIATAPMPGTGSMATTPPPVDAAAISHILLNSLNSLQHAAPPSGGSAVVNQVRLVRDSDDAKQATGLEAVTMDIVAMLFDIIFDDARIPLAVKALLSRLQIPVLKVAMLNPGFFADRQHPTRRFLGCVSGIAIRWGDRVDESDPFYAKLSDLVDRIQAEFEQDVGIFGTALDELEAFVNAREEEENDTALVAANTVIRHEIEAEAWERAHQAVRVFLRETPQPAPVESFLEEHWAAVLRKIAVSDSDTAETDWRMACEVMKDLAWSIIPKKIPDDRLKLIGLLPRLLASLNKGLDSIDITAEQRNAFFDVLVKHHSAALKGESAGAAQADTSSESNKEEAAPITPPSEGDLLVMRSVDHGVQVEEIVLVGASPVWRADDRDIARQVEELKRGSWVEFIDEEGNTSRERLNWISPQRGILLFSNHRSAKAISIAPDALVRQIREGKAALLREDPLFERALSGALESINAE
ncbi:DUF1631 family protein [Propionivibrio sp.]|uniref:DUF1631 family protein n=1 Tax=Propionivibrio sp. TaxID=2212460 RepID=UPI00272EDFBE|nr:DUF1631 family protein [Propionivibrio sp.]